MHFRSNWHPMIRTKNCWLKIWVSGLNARISNSSRRDSIRAYASTFARSWSLETATNEKSWEVFVPKNINDYETLNPLTETKIKHNTLLCVFIYFIIIFIIFFFFSINLSIVKIFYFLKTKLSNHFFKIAKIKNF